MPNQPPNPIVIFGGFLSYASIYSEMKRGLETITGASVRIVNTKGYDWLPIVTFQGWIYLLRKLDQTIREAVQEAPNRKVILIAHSAGGVLGRLYLSGNPFPGVKLLGRKAVKHLITLGSPHKNQAGLTRGGLLSRWINDRYPGAMYSPEVYYTSVGGKYLFGDFSGTSRERWVYNNYQKICGKGLVWGDGLIPIESALLDGSEKLVLDGVSHGQIFGNPWYGSNNALKDLITKTNIFKVIC